MFQTKCALFDCPLGALLSGTGQENPEKKYCPVCAKSRYKSLIKTPALFSFYIHMFFILLE